MLKFLAKYRETGLLLLRTSIGVIFIIFCAPPLLGGDRAWAHFGSGMRALGFHAHLDWWGFFGALAACAGGVLIILGYAFRLGVLLCFLVALVDAIATFKASRSFYSALDVFEVCLILVCLSFIGPGKYSVDKT